MNRIEKASKDRLERAKALAAEVKAGAYQPAQINIMESWYPVRPKIAKDPDALKFIFEEKAEKKK